MIEVPERSMSLSDYLAKTNEASVERGLQSLTELLTECLMWFADRGSRVI